MKSYSFRCLLKGHTSDIKCTSVSDNGRLIASVSRDQICKLWRLEDDNTFNNYCSFDCGEGFPMAVKFGVLSGVEHVLLGGVGRFLRIHLASDGSFVTQFFAHEANLNCIEIRGGVILTSSGDNTIKKWDAHGNLGHTYNYHRASVWCLCWFGTGFFSGSADCTIALWKDDLVAKTYIGHDGPVRSIKVLTNKRHLLSAGNDCNVKIWNIDDMSCRVTFDNHRHYIYDLCLLPTSCAAVNSAFDAAAEISSDVATDKAVDAANVDMFASCGEEKCIKIWRGTNLVDEIVVPGISNWHIEALPNGDLIVASSYPDIMIFTTDPALEAKGDAMEEFQQAVTSSLNHSSTLNDLNIDDIPNVTEGLQQNGGYDGDIKLFRKGTQIVLYEWIRAEHAWKFIGNAVSQIEPETVKTEFDGRKYDYVIDVEMDDGKKLKLPYNNGEDPADAAERFLIKNSLDSFFHKQIFDFLLSNVPSAREFKRHVKIPPKRKSPFPNKKLIVFDATNLDGLVSRVRSLYTAELGVEFENMRTIVKNTIGSLDLNEPQCEIPLTFVNSLIAAGGSLTLPYLDIVKQMVLIKMFFEIYFVMQQNLFQLDLFEYLIKFIDDSIDEKCQMLALRIFCNTMLHHESYRHSFMAFYQRLGNVFTNNRFWEPPSLQLSMSSVLFNYSIILITNPKVDQELLIESLNTCSWILGAFHESFDEQVVCRLLCACGNLLSRIKPRLGEESTCMNDLSIFCVGLECREEMTINAVEYIQERIKKITS